MSSNISAWLVPVLLAVFCVVLVGKIFHTRKVNKSLVGDIETAQAELQVASYDDKECDKKLKAKIAEVAPKDEQVATLTVSVSTLTKEKTNMQEQITKLTADLEEAKAAQTTLKAEKDKLLIWKLQKKQHQKFSMFVWYDKNILYMLFHLTLSNVLK